MSREEHLKALDVENVSFDELLAQSDFVSVHAPLLPSTRGLFNDAAFAKMKKGAAIINTARGPLIDEPALLGRSIRPSAGAGLDVITTEPMPKDLPLIGRDNLILTPHTGFYRKSRWSSCRPNARPMSGMCCRARSQSIRRRCRSRRAG